VTLKRVPARLAVLLTALLGSLFATSPAYAADEVEVSLDSDSTFTIGSRQARQVVVESENDTNRVLTLRNVIVISAPGLAPNHITIQRIGGFGRMSVQSLGDGIVAAVDNQQYVLRGGDDTTGSYQLRFTSRASAGKAEVLALVQGRVGLRFEELGRSNSRTVTVKGGAAAGPTTPTARVTTPPPLTAVPETEPAAAGATPGRAAVDDPLLNPTSGDDDGGPAWSLYAVGALLVGGGGFTLWRMLRRRDDSDDEDEYVDHADADAAAAWSPARQAAQRPVPYSPSYRQPVRQPPPQPMAHTMLMPPVDNPPPAVDPWQQR